MKNPPLVEEQVDESKKSKKQSLKDSFKLFGEDENYDIDANIEYKIPLPKDVTDNILKTSRMIKIATLTIQGYEEVPKPSEEAITFRLTKHPLASSEVIKSFQAILKTHADESNLAAKMTWEEFSIKVLSDWGAFYKLCLKEKASPSNSQRTVYRVFQNCLTCIGGILCDNPKNMASLFQGVNESMREDDARNSFK